MSHNDELRAKLLELDRRSPSETTTRYESEIKAMFEQTLSTRRRMLHAAGAALCAFWAALVLTGVLGDKALPWLVQVIAWFAIGGATAIMIVNGVAAVRGKWKRRMHSQLLILIAGVMLAGMGVVFLRVGAEGDPTWNNAMLQTTGWIFLGILAVSVLMHYMEEQQLKTHAKLLELELRLAQIAERLDKR